MRKRKGGVVEPRELTVVDGVTVPIPDRELLVHLQFRRFAGCPICNLHLQQIVARHDEIAATGIKEVAIFHSSAASLREHVDRDFPFALVPDPEKRLYREFGVEASLRSELHPRALAAGLRGIVRQRGRIGLDPNGGLIGLPADFLIEPDGRIAAVHYGGHAYDQWSVDELLAISTSIDVR